MCRLHIFVLDSHLATLWESNCPYGFPPVMFPLGSSYFVFVFLSLWCLWWEVWDNCISSWSLPPLLFCRRLISYAPSHYLMITDRNRLDQVSYVSGYFEKNLIEMFDGLSLSCEGSTINPLYTELDSTTKFIIMTIWLSQNLRLRGNN